MKKIFRVCIALLLCFSLVTPAFALDGIWHNPYGIDDLYDHEPTEIYPLTPIAGEMIYIKSTTWPIEPGQSVWLTYTKNGEPQQDVGAEWKYNDGNNSYWEAAIGPFAQGDVIEYTVYADKDGQNTQSIGPFSFHVVEWESAQSVELGSQEEGLVVLNVTPDQGDSTPKLGLSFPSADVLRFQFSPLGDVAFEAGAADYSIEEDSNSIIISTSALEVTVTKSPYGVEVRDLDTGKLLTQNGGTGSELSWLTDGAGLVKNFRGRYESPSSEKFYGFGERYNGIEKRGETVDIYVYNQYQNQGERSYLAVPFFYSSKGYGLYLDSTYYAQFDMADSDPNQYTFTVNTSGDDPVLDYYIISGTPEEVIGGYSELSGKPQDMPKWAFGLWMSANEWDRQSEVLSAVENAEAYDIPASVVVLEQWSDENTFYIFNDSTYTARPGGEAFSGSDFTYSEKWPDPASMVDTIHDNGMKVLLWQIPVLKYTDYAWEQKDNDEAYMIEQGYAVGDGEGGQYRIPSSGWFGNNALLAAPGEGWTVGKDVYGDVTYIKAYAASDSNSTYTLEGSSPVDADGQTYEAEYASLFGASTDTQASVNQNHSGYSGAGFVDKLEAAGAGVTFYAKVANAGDYDVTFRYANGDAAERSLSVYVNGAYIGKTIMPSTGHWDTWADCLMQLPLAAGNNIITLKHEDASGDTGYVNLDSCTVPFYPEVITAEAENAALYGTAGTNQDHWNYSGSGFVDGMTSAGAGAEFEITVPKDGSYEASIRYCNGTQATKDLNLYVNGSYIETISFGSIGGNWNEWQELTQTLELDEGRNVVALRYDSSNSGNVNLDKLSVKTEPDATISVPLVDNGGFERDTSQSSAWTEWHPDGQAVAYGVDSGSGTNPPESPYAGDKRAYFYSGSAYQQSIHQGINLPNGTYTVQAWIKVSNTAPDIGRMEVTGYGGDSIYVDMPYAGTGWRLVETDITVTTGYLDIGLYCSSLGGTTVHIDNVKILNK